MPVPEAAVYEDNAAARGHDNIGFAGQVCSMEGEAAAHAVEDGAHDALRSRVARSHGLHTCATLFRSQVVGHTIRSRSSGFKSHC